MRLQSEVNTQHERLHTSDTLEQKNYQKTGKNRTEEGRRQAAFGAWKFERLRGLKYARPLGFLELLQVKGGGGGCCAAA